ncbi:hypothetical protein B0I35DRAFT_384077, partial [Stachybotrys elegans]
MILENAKEVSYLHSLGAKACTWLLLAGYLTFPSTFASLQDSQFLHESGKAGNYIASAVENVPLLYVASFCCAFAAIGLIYLWVRWRHNYVFLMDRIFEPVVIYSFMGLLSTLQNVYAVHKGEWSITATITGSIVCAWFAFFIIIFSVYRFWLLQIL